MGKHHSRTATCTDCTAGKYSASTTGSNSDSAAGSSTCQCNSVCVYYCRTSVLRETTFRGLCGLGCPSRTSDIGYTGTSTFISKVCVYYCSTYYKAVREGGGGEWRTCATRDYEPRPMCAKWGGVCLLLQYLLQSCSRGCVCLLLQYLLQSCLHCSWCVYVFITAVVFTRGVETRMTPQILAVRTTLIPNLPLVCPNRIFWVNAKSTSPSPKRFGLGKPVVNSGDAPVVLFPVPISPLL